ncbi:transposase [Streptomyces sp. NPDC052040]|uniref:transposase n=1 Tax=Streptomyces sp. NPDC052040 TaxID=3365682 RepID=UPI0037CD420E
MEPSAVVVDRQSVKADATVALVSRGYDAGKKINGRKRHVLTDTLGLLLAVLVTPASTTDRDAARILLPAAKKHFRRLARIWADGGYTGHLTARPHQLRTRPPGGPGRRFSARLRPRRAPATNG